MAEIKKKRSKYDDDYLGSAGSFEKTVELKTEDIATNSKKTMRILKEYVDYITKNKDEFSDEEYELEGLEYLDFTNYNLYIHQNGKLYYSFVFKANNSIFLYIAPMYDKFGNLYVPKGNIEVTFVKNGKRYGFNASVVEFKDNLIKIKRETKYYFAELRSEDRVAVDIAANIFLDDVKGSAVIIDLSKSGALIQTDFNLSVGSKFAIEFYIKNTKFAMFAKVARMQTIKQRSYFGIQFLGGINDGSF
ncbi:MAG: PilZ domain-containing protein [Candidatus Micrarchaeaceae archaeon]